MKLNPDLDLEQS